MELTKEWIRRGVSAGALPPTQCEGGTFDCPFLRQSGELSEGRDCALLNHPAPTSLVPMCRAGDWLFEAVRIQVNHGVTPHRFGRVTPGSR